MRPPLRHKASIVSSIVPGRVAKELVAEFDEHIGALSVLFHQYLKHAWLNSVTESYGGLAWQHQAEVFDNLNAVASATLGLGGVPLSSPLEQVNYSYLEHEAEGVFDLPVMLQSDAAHEKLLEQRLIITLEVARDLAALETGRLLGTLIAAAKTRHERIDRFAQEAG